jgi:hypothetical protein
VAAKSIGGAFFVNSALATAIFSGFPEPMFSDFWRLLDDRGAWER